jgi:hypothetical protein
MAMDHAMAPKRNQQDIPQYCTRATLQESQDKPFHHYVPWASNFVALVSTRHRKFSSTGPKLPMHHKSSLWGTQIHCIFLRAPGGLDKERHHEMGHYLV